MSNNDENEPGLAIAPPAIILIVIIATVVSVVVAASVYRICRTFKGVNDADEEYCPWNPNKVSLQQRLRMEEVRIINNMHAWEEAKSIRANRVHEKYRAGTTTRRHDEERRPRHLASWNHFNDLEDSPFGRGEWCDVFKVSESDILEFQHLNVNPYRGMLRQIQSDRGEAQARPRRPEFEVSSSRTDVSAIESPTELAVQAATLQNEVIEQRNSSPQAMVTVTLNDDTEDIADGFHHSQYQHLYPTEMSRSSSIYSGDLLSPSNNAKSIMRGHGPTSQPSKVNASAIQHGNERREEDDTQQRG